MVFKWNRITTEMDDAQNVFEVPRFVISLIKKTVNEYNPKKKDGLVLLIGTEDPSTKYNEILSEYQLTENPLKDIYIDKTTNIKWVFERHLINARYEVLLVYRYFKDDREANTIHCTLPLNSIKRLRGLSNFLGKTQDEIIIEALDRIFVHYNPDESVL